MKKGEFPYEYIDNEEKFKEEQLPSFEKFNSSLTPLNINNNEHKEILQKKYNHALKVWQTFNIKNLGQYNDLYLTLDVLLLADVFENFRSICLKNYQLDPAHYLTAPSLSMDALLKMYGKRIELFNENQSDMYFFCEQAIRGGNSMITHRYSKANNKYIKGFKINNEIQDVMKHIIYLDANNLYGWSMSQFLPVGCYKWNSSEWDERNIMNIKADSNIGYIFEVDLEYPKEIHDKHMYYPLCPEKKIIDDSMLSNYAKRIKDKLNITSDHAPKLICD